MCFMFYVFKTKLLNFYVYANLGVWALNNEKIKLEPGWGFEKSSAVVQWEKSYNKLQHPTSKPYNS